MDLSLPVVPLLEVIALVLLMTRVDLGQEDHLVHEFTLVETLFDEDQIRVLGMYKIFK